MTYVTHLIARTRSLSAIPLERAPLRDEKSNVSKDKAYFAFRKYVLTGTRVDWRSRRGPDIARSTLAR